MKHYEGETMKTFVAYYRVSTAKQGTSGLGLQSQQETVKKSIGGGVLVAEYTEIESGKNDKRIELQKAIDYAKKNNATLIIAKLDRLSRNASFIFALRDSNVDFFCCDLPDANSFTIGIFALLAQQERELISERTTKALAAKKANGFKLGKPENFTNESRSLGNAAYHQKAVENENNVRANSLIVALRAQKLSYSAIADRLNESGFKTSKGNAFFPATVKQVESLFQHA